MEAFRAQLLFILLLLARAWEGQREAVFNPLEPGYEDSHNLQKPIDFFEMMGQTLVDPVRPVTGPRIDGLRSGEGLSDPPVIPNIAFPLARPTPNNINAICQYSNRRPRYPKEILPQRGYGYLHRQAHAINQLESWFTFCCGNDFPETLTLCCAQQAWEQSVSTYCEEESRIKTLQPRCCLQRGSAKYACFEKEAADHSYQTSGLVWSRTTLPFTNEGFHFDRSICQAKSISETAFESLPESEIRIRSISVSPDADMRLQRMVVPEIPEIVREKGHSRPFVTRPLTKPNIPFPLARPTPSNIHAICQYSNQRPRYLKENLPRNGYGYLHRQANAVNQLESWFTVCCSKGIQEDLSLCCAQQAWEKSLSAFCEDEFGVKTRHYHCCLQHGSARSACFEREALNKSYQPSGKESSITHPFTVQGFDFNQSICHKTSISEFAPRAIRDNVSGTPNISFPPGRPNSVNIVSICGNRKNRPRYLSDCLPQRGFGWLVRQSKAMNNLEKGFGQCCKENKDVQTCTERKWKKMVNNFCKADQLAKVNQFHCCKHEQAEEQYDCFTSAAPNPYYILQAITIDNEKHPTLNMICDKTTSFHRMKLPFNLNKVVEQCCTLLEEMRPECIQLQLEDVCKAGDLTSVSLNCCKANPKRRSECLSKLLLHNIAKVKRDNHNRRRICPLTF